MDGGMHILQHERTDIGWTAEKVLYLRRGSLFSGSTHLPAPMGQLVIAHI